MSKILAIISTEMLLLFEPRAPTYFETELSIKKIYISHGLV